MAVNEKKLVIRVESVSKSFPGVRALNDIDFDLIKGEVHALVGENGAGKSTLSKIISGIYSKDTGRIYLNGAEINPHGPAHAVGLGISIIHQELNLVPVLSIAENIALGREKTNLLLIDRVQSDIIAREYMDKVGLSCPSTTKIRDLSIAEQQLVEVAKALSYNTEVLIMDEPIAPLTGKEVNRLFSIIASLKERGVSIIYVSHKLEEIFTISDRITVLRDGEKVGTYDTVDMDRGELIKCMVGRELKEMYHKKTAAKDKTVVLNVRNLRRHPVLNDISFDLHKGEILGIAGLMGAGRTELVRAIFGSDPIERGRIEIDGKIIPKPSPMRMIRNGVGFIPEDRKQQGIILPLSILKNITIGILSGLSRFGLIKTKAERTLTQEKIRALNIKCPSMTTQAGQLSGGNQQKVVIAKWLASSANILIMDEPTRGIDVGAKEEIYKLMSSLCSQGVSIIMISSELPEIIGMSDRIIVMSEGRITGELMRDEATEERIMHYATIRGEKSCVEDRT